MAATTATYNYILDFLFELQSKGRYSFTLHELRNQFQINEKALLQNLYRLKRKSIIAHIRQEFYVIIPPEYSHTGILPATLFLDDMMKYLNKKYYLGLYSAAALHGASHQQPMQYQVITETPALRLIRSKKLSINFIAKRIWNNDNIVDIKTEAGYIKVSSPELTVFDLIQYHKSMGGLNRSIIIIDDLVEEIKISALSRISKTQKAPPIQRLGFILDKLGYQKLSKALHGSLKDRRTREIPLSLSQKNKGGKGLNKWKIIQNIELDLE